MYLEQIETERGKWFQGCIEFPYVKPSAASEEALSAILSTSTIVADLEIAVRLTVDSTSRLHRCAIFTAPAREEERLRKFISLFARMEVAAPGSIEIPSCVERFDASIGSFPRYQLRTVATRLRRGSAWFSTRFRVGPRLEQLILESRALGIAISYQMNASAERDLSSYIKSCRYNLLSMQGLPGLPPAVARMQQEIVTSMPSRGHWVEEFVGTSVVSDLLVLNQSLRRHFQLANPDLRSDIIFDPGRFPDLLAAGLHSAFRCLPEPDEACSMAADANEIASLVKWRPGPLLAKELEMVPQPAFANPADRRESSTHTLAYGLQPYCGNKPFVFVSYRHADLPAIAPHLRRLQVSGISYWLDQAIPGSSEWTQVLEERIQNCIMLVVFLSQSAVDSKYVRREILMADALDKPILTVRIGEPELRWGLKLVLAQYQMVSVNATPVEVVIRQALSNRHSNQTH